MSMYSVLPNVRRPITALLPLSEAPSYRVSHLSISVLLCISFLAPVGQFPYPLKPVIHEGDLEARRGVRLKKLCSDL